jgi:hypothetical protein
VVIREREQYTHISMECPVLGDFRFFIGRTEDWFAKALRAHNAIGGIDGMEFERPLGYANGYPGAYYSLLYDGKPLSLSRHAQLGPERILAAVRAIAAMHSEGVYHGHLLLKNIMLAGNPESPALVIIDPKLTHELGMSETKSERMRHARHDLFPLLCFAHSKLGGNGFLGFLEQAEEAYQATNRVGDRITGGNVGRSFFPRG